MVKSTTNKLSPKEIRKRIENKFGDKIEIIEIIDRKNITVKSNVCSHVYKKSLSNLLKGTDICTECASRNRDKLHLTKEDFYKRYSEFKEKYEVVGNWINSSTRTTILCKNCNKKWNTNPLNLVTKKSKCPYCEGGKTKIDTIYLSTICKDNGFTVLSECNSSEDIVKFRHDKCGNEFERKARILIKRFSCPECKVNSRGEEIINKVLIKNNISFKKECAFKDLRGTKGGYLRFDFGIYENDKLKYFIEYDGKQHFEDVGYKYFGESFEKCKKHDEIKNKYCEDNDYILLRISYHQRRTVDKIVLNFLNKYKLIPSQANES